jgi:hypothetical protein
VTRGVRAAAAGLGLLLASACQATGDGELPARLEFLASRRDPDDRWSLEGRDTHGVFGATIVKEPRGAGWGTEAGLRGADFSGRVGASGREEDSWFAELHVGARYYPLPSSWWLRPFAGAGISLAFGEHTEGEDPDEVEYYDPDETYWDWLPGGFYAQLGLDLRLEPLIFSAAFRAAYGDGIDPFARHPDDWATDLVASVGVRW